jgi:hypothetical protein
MENATDVWIDLKERFAQGDLVCVSKHQQQTYSLKQKFKTVTEFYYELKILWEEPEIYMRFLTTLVVSNAHVMLCVVITICCKSHNFSFIT